MREQDIFIEAMKRDCAAERNSYLEETCGDDGELRARVLGLIRHHDRAGSFLEHPLEPFVATVDMPAALERPGALIGPYKLLQQIGEGGFGIVYMAEQTEPIRRKVALKIIKPGMDTKEVIARFEAERQALALMDHPNVAKVLDAGSTESGRPYFVMELVKGVPITDFCDELALSTMDRLRLFVDICRAIQHAHHKGIIHRDIKPSNVMVSMRDDRAVPKVIDFGVAKALSQQLTAKTLFTAYGQMVGTPLYMSPEQAQMNDIDVDTRSDIFSLGVLLYELLTGTTPFDKETLKNADFDELRRIILEDEPLRPSARVSTLKAKALSTVSARRQVDPRRLARSLHGELDWVVMKALEKDRTRRYESASAFAADVERFLNDAPVQACPPSAAYRFRKFALRNKTALVTTALILISLLAGTGISIWQAFRATTAEHLAQLRLEDIEKQQQQAEAQSQRAEANLQMALETLEQLYLPLAEDEFSEQFEITERDRQFLQQVLPFYEQLAAQKAGDPNMLFIKAHAYLRVGNIYQNLRAHPDEQNGPAEAALSQAITLFQQLADAFPGNLEYQRKLAQSYRSVGTLLHPQRRTEAKQAYQTAIALYEPVLESGTAWDYASRATCYREIKRYDEALADFRRAVELESNNAHFHHLLCGLYGNLPDIHLRGGAVEHGQKAVELEPGNAKYHANLAYAYRWQGDFQAVREACAKALSLDANQPDANRMMGEVLLREGDFEQALPFAHKAVAGYRHRPAMQVYKTRGEIYAGLGQYQEALADYDQAVELGPQQAWIRKSRAVVYCQVDQWDKALADITTALELDPPDSNALTWCLPYVSNAPPDFRDQLLRLADRLVERLPDSGSASAQRGMLRAHYELREHAFEDFTKAIERMPASAPLLRNTAWFVVRRPGWEAQAVDQALTSAQRATELRPNDAIVRNTLGVALYRAGEYAEAIEALHKAESLSPGTYLGYNGLFLVMAHWQLGQQDEARQWYDKAIEWMENRADKDEELAQFRVEADELLGLTQHATEGDEASTERKSSPDE